MSKTISLVLGSGGAKGHVHIGVIHELEKHGYSIESISGSSMGALVGGLYACGKLDTYEKWITTMDAFDIFRLVDLSFSSSGFIKGDRVFDKIAEMIGDINIEDLPIKLTVVCTDVVNKREVWIQKGSLKDAIRASVAIPTLLTPKEINGKLLFDGGVLAPLPILPTLSDFTDMVVAVNLNDDKPIIEKYEHLLSEKDVSIEDKVKILLTKESLGFFSTFNKSIEAMQELISRYQLASQRADILIDISSEVCDFYDFHKAKRLIAYGEAVTKDVLSLYKQALQRDS